MVAPRHPCQPKPMLRYITVHKRRLSFPIRGVVKLTCFHAMTRPAGRQLHPGGCLCGRSQARDFPPVLESLTHLLAIHCGREPVAPRSEVLGEGTIGRKKALGVSWRFELLHASFPLTRGLVRIFRPITEVAMLSMFHTGQDLALRRAIARQFIRNDHPRHVGQALQQFAKELLRGLSIPPPLYENIQDMAVLIHRPPEIVTCTVDGEEDLIEGPLVAGPRAPPAEPIGIGLPKLPTPIAHGLVG
jgi:hypothetical protein